MDVWIKYMDESIHSYISYLYPHLPIQGQGGLLELIPSSLWVKGRGTPWKGLQSITGIDFMYYVLSLSNKL